MDDARDLREKAFFGPARSRYKIYIIDEAHMVTSAGFNALLKVVEEPPEHLKFIFATTEPEKVIGTIRSRTHHYPFRLVPPGTLREYLAEVCQKEAIPVEDGVLPLVVRAGGGSVRDSMSVMDQLLAGAAEDGVTYAMATALLGYTDGSLLDSVVEAFATGDGPTAFEVVDRVIEGGNDPRRFVTDLLERLRDLVILAAVPDAAEKGLIDAPADVIERMQAQAGTFGAAKLRPATDLVNEGLTEMHSAASPRLPARADLRPRPAPRRLRRRALRHGPPGPHRARRQLLRGQEPPPRDAGHGIRAAARGTWGSGGRSGGRADPARWRPRRGPGGGPGLRSAGWRGLREPRPREPRRWQWRSCGGLRAGMRPPPPCRARGRRSRRRRVRPARRARTHLRPRRRRARPARPGPSRPRADPRLHAARPPAPTADTPSAPARRPRPRRLAHPRRRRQRPPPRRLAHGRTRGRRHPHPRRPRAATPAPPRPRPLPRPAPPSTHLPPAASTPARAGATSSVRTALAARGAATCPATATGQDLPEARASTATAGVARTGLDDSQPPYGHHDEGGGRVTLRRRTPA
ncbi:hypothetical protein SVIOM74S_05948 [Streptomyces violarus]